VARKLYQLEGVAAIVASSPARRRELAGDCDRRRDPANDSLAVRLATVAFLVLLIAGLAAIVAAAR